MKTRPAFSARGTRRLTVTFIASMTLAMSGCTTVRSVPVAQLAQSETVVRVGDRVNCTLKDGSQAAFKVTAVEPGALIGKQQRVAVPDVERLTTERLDLKKTAVKTGKAAALIVAVPVVIVASGGFSLLLL